MTLREQIPVILIAAYVLIGIITFGHAASKAEARLDAEHAACMVKAKKPNECWQPGEIPGADGLMAAMFWPLYVSWEAWK